MANVIFSGKKKLDKKNIFLTVFFNFGISFSLHHFLSHSVSLFILILSFLRLRFLFPQTLPAATRQDRILTVNGEAKTPVSIDPNGPMTL